MAAFSDFYKVLPDPSHPIGLAGEQDALGSAGPGFATLTLRSHQDIMGTRHPSGREENCVNEEHYWIATINYNPLPCQAFHTIFTFLQLKKAELEPFYIFLPQYMSQNITNKSLSASALKGDETLLIDGTGVTVGSVFNLSNHDKTYLVTRVETETDYYTPNSSPGAGKERIHIMPSLFMDSSSGNGLDFSTTKMTVMQTRDTDSYNLPANNNLFTYSLELEEVLT